MSGADVQFIFGQRKYGRGPDLSPSPHNYGVNEAILSCREAEPKQSQPRLALTRRGDLGMIDSEITAVHPEKTSEPVRDMSANRLPYDHRGIVVVASIWLAFYLLAGIHHFWSGGNQNREIADVRLSGIEPREARR
jgi:hypothetical protein